MTEKLDNIDLVKLLRILAIAMFVLNIAAYLVLAFDIYGDPLKSSDGIPFILMQTATSLVNAVFSPAVLLALAEIVRVLRKDDAGKDA